MRCVVLVACLGACTQDFDTYVGDGGANDAAVSCDVATACIASTSSCGQACITGFNTCKSACTTDTCKSQCKDQQTTCNGTCVTSCVSCADAGTCAQTPCQGALP